MSHYWFNRQKLLEETKSRYHNSSSQENAAKYYIANKNVIKEKSERLVRKRKRSKKST